MLGDAIASKNCDVSGSVSYVYPNNVFSSSVSCITASAKQQLFFIHESTFSYNPVSSLEKLFDLSFVLYFHPVCEVLPLVPEFLFNFQKIRLTGSNLVSFACRQNFLATLVAPHCKNQIVGRNLRIVAHWWTLMSRCSTHYTGRTTLVKIWILAFLARNSALHLYNPHFLGSDGLDSMGS